MADAGALHTFLEAALKLEASALTSAIGTQPTTIFDVSPCPRCMLACLVPACCTSRSCPAHSQPAAAQAPSAGHLCSLPAALAQQADTSKPVQGAEGEMMGGEYDEAEDMTAYPDAPRDSLGMHDSLPDAPTSQLPSSYARKENTSNIPHPTSHTPQKANGRGTSGPQAIPAV